MAATTKGVLVRLLAVHLSLDKAGLDHAVGGALALDHYVYPPRGTADIDLKLTADPADPDRVFSACRNRSRSTPARQTSSAPIARSASGGVQPRSTPVSTCSCPRAQAGWPAADSLTLCRGIVVAKIDVRTGSASVAFAARVER
jgi:hypothetical protein